MRKGYRFVVHGCVQGVGFRQATVHKARLQQLDGWVMNRADGSVEGEVCHADPGVLTEFHRWLQRGPSTARVDAVEWVEIPATEPLGADFSIRY